MALERMRKGKPKWDRYISVVILRGSSYIFLLLAKCNLHYKRLPTIWGPGNAHLVAMQALLSTKSTIKAFNRYSLLKQSHQNSTQASWETSDQRLLLTLGLIRRALRFHKGWRAKLQVIKIPISHLPQGRTVTRVEEIEEEISLKKVLHWEFKVFKCLWEILNSIWIFLNSKVCFKLGLCFINICFQIHYYYGRHSMNIINDCGIKAHFTASSWVLFSLMLYLRDMEGFALKLHYDAENSVV